MTDIDELMPIKENKYGIVQHERSRPYASSQEEQTKVARFIGLERQILDNRINEIDSRAKQLEGIYRIKRDGLYTVTLDPLLGVDTRSRDKAFRDWLCELDLSGVSYGASRMKWVNKGGTKPEKRLVWAWDEYEKAISICLKKGLSLEDSCKVATVGIKALQKYLKTGIISVQSDEIEPTDDSGNVIDQPKEDNAPTIHDGRYTNEEQASLLLELAETNSSKGATMLANARIGDSRWPGITNIWVEKESPVGGGKFTDYNVEFELVNGATGERNVYEGHVLFEKDTDPKVVKWMLDRVNKSMSDIVY